MESKNLIGAFVVGLALFAAWLFVWGKWQTVQALRETLIAREAMVAERQDALDNLQSEFDKFDEKLSGDSAEKFSAMVPVQRETAEIISTIDTITTGTGMSLIELDIREESRSRRGQKKEATEEVTINIELEGSYASFKSFLGQLERNVRLMNVESLDIDQGNIPGVQLYSVEIKTVFVP